MVSLIERCDVPDLPISTAVRVLDALDVEIDLRLAVPTGGGRQRDAAHARCVAYVARRLESHGFRVAAEVPIVHGRWHGFIDVLAYHPVDRLLVILEVKTELPDIGAMDRQLGMAERCAWDAAHRLGWRPRSATSALLLLSTDENDRRLSANGSWFNRRFRVRAREINRLLSDPARTPERGVRGLAMFDPRSRRSIWVRATWLDGRRTPASYRDRTDYLRRR
jgi:hypothetical protein